MNATTIAVLFLLIEALAFGFMCVFASIGDWRGSMGMMAISLIALRMIDYLSEP